MKILRSILIGTIIGLTIASCTGASKKDIKPRPEHVGVDPSVQKYVDEFFELSARKNIKFKKRVTVGVKTIERGGSVIGLCTVTRNWREVDLEKSFLDYEGELRRKILTFHELVHCYCTRGHDHKGEKYQSGLEEIIGKIGNKARKAIPWCVAKVMPGYLEDGCPASIMHPYILTQSCIKEHYDYYIDEMFEGCEAY